MGTVVPSPAGPKRPQDRVLLSRRPTNSPATSPPTSRASRRTPARAAPVAGSDYSMDNGDVVIAAITSCTNTSNPSVLVAAGLVAKRRTSAA